MTNLRSPDEKPGVNTTLLERPVLMRRKKKKKGERSKEREIKNLLYLNICYV